MKVPVSWWGRRLNCSCCCLQEATIFCDTFLGTSRDETCVELCKTCSVLQPQVQYTVCSALMGRRAHRDRGFPHFLLCDLSWCFGLCRINLEAFVLLSLWLLSHTSCLADTFFEEVCYHHGFFVDYQKTDTHGRCTVAVLGTAPDPNGKHAQGRMGSNGTEIWLKFRISVPPWTKFRACYTHDLIFTLQLTHYSLF